MGHSAASTSPYSGSSAGTSRSSSSTPSLLPEELADNNGPNIHPVRVKHAYEKLTEILDNLQIERASDSKEKHKRDERRRRKTHKELRRILENLCVPMLNRLQKSNIEGLEDNLYRRLIQAMMTGNHKKHHTATAIQLALIIEIMDLVMSYNEHSAIVREQASRIESLERYVVLLCNALDDAGISPPVMGQTSSPSPLAGEQNVETRPLLDRLRALETLSRSNQ